MSQPGGASAGPALGSLFGGKYLIESVLGRGGMGVVLAARHVQLGEKVALKFLLAANTQQDTARFFREAKIAARLRSDHVARVFDVGSTEEGVPFLIMELLEGRDLGAELETRRSLPLAEVADHVLQACAALALAHHRGVVHRDLKPSNLFLTTAEDGTACVKVVDFGISKLLEEESGELSLTQTRSLLGTPLYMAPEQLRSARNVDARADVWSLGVILHELVAGTPPFDAESLADLIATVLTQEPPKLSVVKPGVPEAFEAVIAGCLRANKEERTPTAIAVAEALLPFATERGRVAFAKAQRAALGISSSGSTPMPTQMAAFADTLAGDDSADALPALAVTTGDRGVPLRLPGIVDLRSTGTLADRGPAIVDLARFEGAAVTANERVRPSRRLLPSLAIASVVLVGGTGTAWVVAKGNPAPTNLPTAEILPPPSAVSSVPSEAPVPSVSATARLAASTPSSTTSASATPNASAAGASRSTHPVTVRPSATVAKSAAPSAPPTASVTRKSDRFE